MSRGLLLSTAAVVLASASVESIRAGDAGWPPASVVAGTAAATLGLSALGASAPQLATGLTVLILLTALMRLPWEALTGPLDQPPSSPVPRNVR